MGGGEGEVREEVDTGEGRETGGREGGGIGRRWHLPFLYRASSRPMEAAPAGARAASSTGLPLAAALCLE